MATKIPLMLLPSRLTLFLAKPLQGITTRLTRFIPGLKYDIEQSAIDDSPSLYMGKALVNATALGFFFFALLFVLQRLTNPDAGLARSILLSLVLFALFAFTLLRYPRIIAGKLAEQVDKNLIFAIKDLRLQIRAGVTLYKSLVNVAHANYGASSSQFRLLARDVKAGMPIDVALQRLATQSKSVFLRRTTWQLVNTLKAGASLEEALRTLIRELTLDRRDKIKSYTAELNLWILLYMMFAVAIPSIGATLLVVLSSFAGFGITAVFFVFFISMTVFVQIVLIGFVKTRRPVVNM